MDDPSSSSFDTAASTAVAAVLASDGSGIENWKKHDDEIYKLFLFVWDYCDTFILIHTTQRTAPDAPKS